VVRARDLGIRIGRMAPGPNDAITDVAGVRVGHRTLIRGDGPLVVGKGPVRTGVTVIVPHDGDVWREPLFAGWHRLNGNGELTGLQWIAEAGLLGGVVGLTNTHSVGAVHEALVRAAASHGPTDDFWALPVVGETYDGLLNDINGFHVRPADAEAALDDALRAPAHEPIGEGNVGGGTGMVCHGFKGGIGTASRAVGAESGGWMVGVLVQANYGRRDLLRIDGVPVGLFITDEEVPNPWLQALGLERRGEPAAGDAGSIIIVVATDAPLLPHQCDRLAQRASLGLARMGSIAGHSSGDLILVFATANRGMSVAPGRRDPRLTHDVRAVTDRAIDPLFEATAEATEAAIVNALLAAETMTGRDGVTAHAVPHDRLVEILAVHGRPVAAR